MARLLPLLLLLSACSTGSHYERGAYRPVAPNSTFNPSEDAPHRTGQPGHIRPRALPRSPHSRELPQTPETRKHSALWASGSLPDTLTEVAGVPLPLNPEAELSEKRPAQMCARWMKEDLASSLVVAKALKQMDETTRRCIVLDTFHECLLEMLTLAEQAKYRGVVYSAEAFAGLRAAHRRAKEANCPPERNSKLPEPLRTYWLWWSKTVATHVYK